MRHLYFLIRFTTQTKGSHRMILDNQLAFLQTSYRRLDFLEIFTRHSKEILDDTVRNRLLLHNERILRIGIEIEERRIQAEQEAAAKAEAERIAAEQEAARIAAEEEAARKAAEEEAARQAAEKKKQEDSIITRKSIVCARKVSQNMDVLCFAEKVNNRY